MKEINELIKDIIKKELEKVVQEEVQEVQEEQEEIQEEIQEESLSSEEIKQLRELLKIYNSNQLKEFNYELPKEKVKNRSVLVYPSDFNNFTKWAKDNRLSQAEALHLATKLLMETYKRS